MRLFIHHVPIHLISSQQGEKQPGHRYDRLPIHFEEIFQGTGHAFVTGISAEKSAEWLHRFFLEGQPLPDLTLTWVVEDIKRVKKLLKAQFEWIEAAGGVVLHEGQFLLIQRFGLWDLPKGKIESNEKPKKAAVREVWEECGVPCQPVQKIGNTWHTYTFLGKPVLKKTYWFIMRCDEAHTLCPQQEEDITAVDWFTEEQTTEQIATSYPSIQWVWKKYQRLKAQKKEDNL